MKKYKKFIDLGFDKIGEWEQSNSNLLFRIKSDLSISNFLYAFVIGNDIRYIGKSSNTLYKRLNGYKNPGNSQKTNIRVKQLILDSLSNDEVVEIYLFLPKEIIHYKGFQINLPAGLEDNLIVEFQPKWNLLSK